MAQKKVKKSQARFTLLFSNKNLKRACFALLLICIIINISFAILSSYQKYFVFNFWPRYPQLKQTYLDSQYVNKHPKGWIPDETVNSYAGGAYITGTSPILIAPDT